MDREENNQPSAATLQLICGAILAMPLVYVVVAATIRFAGVIPEAGVGDLDGPTTLILTAAFLVAGIFMSVLAPVLKAAILRNIGEGEEAPVTRFRAVLVAMALSESGAVMGFVLILLTGNLLYGALLCGLSFAATCFLFPRRDWLERGDDPR